jgi:hypothetical protein
MSLPDLHRSPAVVVEETVEFTLDELGRVTRTSTQWLVALVHEGVLQPRAAEAAAPAGWRFGGEVLPRVRRAQRLARDFELEPHALALALQLLDRIDTLQRELLALSRG